MTVTALVLQLVHDLAWPAVVGGLGVFILTPLRARFRDAPNIHAKAGDNEISISAAAEQQQLATSVPPAPIVDQKQIAGDKAGTSTFADVSPDEKQRLQAVIAALVNGWKFERIWRLIHQTQLDMLLELRSGQAVAANDIKKHYEAVPGITKKTWTFEAWINWLVVQHLIASFASASGATYQITDTGRALLDFIATVQAGTLWPGVPPVDQLPKGI